MEPNGLHAPQKTWVLNIPFNGESQIQSPRTNTGLGAESSPLGPGLCPVMRGCLPLTLNVCVRAAPSPGESRPIIQRQPASKSSQGLWFSPKSFLSALWLRQKVSTQTVWLSQIHSITRKQRETPRRREKDVKR